MAGRRSTGRAKGLSEADLAVWAAYTRGLQLLPGRKPLVIAPDPVLLPPPQVQPPAMPKPRQGVPPVNVNLPPPGLDRASWQRFRAGTKRPARVLDLHGMTAAQAHAAVLQFVLGAYGARLRVVEIITGKGEVLHRELPLWLNSPQLRPAVLALAHPHAANTGSLRILLRRQPA